MKPTVFISYSSKDRQFAQLIAQTLEQQGLDVWIDRDDIRAGIKWSSAIQAGLAQSSIMIVIITPDAMTSKNVEDEWQYYLDKSKPIVPILHRATDNIHFQLMRIQYVDFVNYAFEDAVKRLIYELRQHGVDIAVAETPTDAQEQSLPVPPAKASNQRRNSTLAIVGAGVTIALVLIAVLMNRDTNSSDAPTDTSVIGENTPVLTSPGLELSAAATDAPQETTEEATAPANSEPAIGVLLDIPYVSQFGDDAPFPNDDGPASLLMILRWYAQTFTSSTTATRVIGLTVEDVSLAAGMTADSNFVTISGLLTAANSYALPRQFCRGMSRARIFEELDNGRPVLILVNFEALRPDLDFVGGHSVVVVGYDAENVIIYDPHNSEVAPEPKIISAPYEFFESIIVNIPQNQPASQALIFGEDNEC